MKNMFHSRKETRENLNGLEVRRPTRAQSVHLKSEFQVIKIEKNGETFGLDKVRKTCDVELHVERWKMLARFFPVKPIAPFGIGFEQNLKQQEDMVVLMETQWNSQVDRHFQMEISNIKRRLKVQPKASQEISKNQRF